MEIRPLVVFLAVCVALFAVSHGCSTGKEFITTFLPNFQRTSGKNHRLHVVLTAQDSPANVHITVASVGFSRQLSLSAGQTRWISLPCGSELQKPSVNANSAVRISSSAAISVVSYNRRTWTGDGAAVSPMEELGTNYVVYTPTKKRDNVHKLVAIVNGNKPNQIVIRSPVTRGGRKQKTIQLAPYASYLIRCRKTLTGMLIQSQHPVAVLAGHNCLALYRTCEHVYEQLPHEGNLGKEYILPRSTSNCASDWAAIVAAEDNTEVFLHNKKHLLRKAGDMTLQKSNTRQPMVIKSNKKVMVLLLSNNRPNDPFLVTLTPTDKLATDWAVETPGGIQSTVVILSEREGAGSVKVCLTRTQCNSPTWKSFPSDNRWMWSNVPVGIQQMHITVKGDARMAVYAFGGARRNGYGIAGVCSEESPTPITPRDTCEHVKCREKERCASGQCIHLSTATCHSLGDPHYKTFDGRPYDFQGNCKYILSTVTTKASDLEHFTVIAKNDHLGNRRVSFVRKIIVSVFKQTITIGTRKGYIEVNDELQCLPVSLLGGKITVRMSGSYASLTTNFGLNIKFDWNSRLYITVPSSYYKHLGGLCGNYNGDMKDDLPEPTGKKMSAVLTMIKKWKVRTEDVFCHDNCAGRCPVCSMTQQKHYRHTTRCGVMSKTDGPFSACFSKLNPILYEDDCVYDVCINKGARRFLCENLKSYADACMAEDVKVDPKWRTVTKCPLPCPAGSHYEACGTPCPPTCVAPGIDKLCKGPCVEGCQCDKGWVLSGDRCVPKSKCGCQHKGKYYPAGTTFWEDNTCSTRCKCLGTVKCTSVGCKKSEHCGVRKGVRDCYPTSYATCTGSGDPHYQGFDKRRFDFQGTCTYILSQVSKTPDPSLERFQVLVQNENRGRNKAVSYTKSVSLLVFGDTIISMGRSNPGRVLVNGRSVNLPYSMEDGKLNIYRHGYFGVVATSFGLTLKFNWNSHVILTLPSSYSSAVGGLCGNYNGKNNDDFMQPDGNLAKHVNTFGHSWKAGGVAGCTSDCPRGKCPKCEPGQIQRYRQQGYCGIISDKNGPFKLCHGKVSPAPFLNDCIFDMCMYHGHASTLCNSISAYSTACQNAGAKVASWRTKDFCPAPCGANSHYEVCAPPCQLTCSGLAPPEGCDEKAACSEGCVCDDGFMLSDDKCVPVAECGCRYNGQYYRIGEVFYPRESCTPRCVCSDGGEVECDNKFQCTANEKCVVKKGFAYCTPKSIGSCSVSGVRTVKSFDGQTYPLWGNCLFKLVEVTKEEGEMEAFSVYVQQQTSEKGLVSRSVQLRIDDLEITMEPSVVWAIKVDNVRVFLPALLADGKVRVHQNGINIIIETDFDLRLTYDSVAGVFLQLPSTYRSILRGLCGNYNGQPSDDPAPSDKKPADTAAVWVVNDKDKACDTSCSADSCPKPDKGNVPDAVRACQIIKDQGGPFVGCHSTIPPLPHFNACVKEMSADKKNKDTLCRHIQNYVTTCQLAGAKIKEWRTSTFCPVKCPAGSHYELCTSTCSSTCFSLQKSQPCPVCQEGCQCDEGLMSDGVRCVTAEKCGCVVEGQYYQSGSTVYLEDCSQSCSCQSGRFSCKAAECKKDEKCRNKDGIIGCYSTDPCAEVECRVKEHCVVTEGQAECVPDSKALCWAFGDPHYTTFDGFKYSFQGTCTYVLVNTTGLDPSLPQVTVITKNEVRGNIDGSFLHSATVDLLGHQIFIPTVEDKGTILVDGIRSMLPVSLEEGRISVISSGFKGVLRSDIGVEITFDWVTLLMVSISSSYYGNVAGLCGNYNGKTEDDLTTPTGAKAVNVTHWAGTWSIEDNDPFCYHYCEGECPECSRADRKKYSGPEYCGILGNTNGPFASCHAKVPVKEFVSDCLYDVCVNNGRQEVLCEVLSAYLAECQEAGARVLPWREMAKCPVECPAHSHYTTCGSACPPTCSPQPIFCHKMCVEGCFCDKGYVQSGEECVIREKGCGCNYQGHYYLPDTTFWADSQCKEKCVCDSATQKVKCEEVGCGKGEKCGIVDGVQDCYPIGFKTCTARGDPHFLSFDGRKFDFQGNCVYKLARLSKKTKGLRYFEVNLENNHRGNKRVSYAKVVTVKVYGNAYIFSVDYPGRVLVDGIETFLPFTKRSRVKVYRRHRLAVLETSFLKVSFDFTSAVRVELATSYHGATSGLCGNFNDDPADDFMLPSGKLATSANEFGVNQWLADVTGCSHDCKDCAEPLPRNFKPPPHVVVCDIIIARDGPLGNCVDKVDSKQYHQDCIYDMVLTEGRQQSACDIISDYVEECQRNGVCVKPWRTRRFCWMHCGANSMYSMTAPGCPKTCHSRPPAKCNTAPSEGCICSPGFLLSQDRCVPQSQCGCHFKGRYVGSGQKFYADSDCQRLCTCYGGMVACKKKPCGDKQHCRVINGVRGCFTIVRKVQL